ncbi:MAG: GIY-YIG nuclease family protein [Gammaproteobacteria bacterium]
MPIDKFWTYDKGIISAANKILNENPWDVIVAKYENIEKVPVLPGIYMFSTQTTILHDERTEFIREPYYVGKSDVSIFSRFKKHIIKPQWKKTSYSYGENFIFSYLTLEDENYETILDLEDTLIRAFGPLMNEKYSKSRQSAKCNE